MRRCNVPKLTLLVSSFLGMGSGAMNVLAQATLAESERDKDAYAVYSLMLAKTTSPNERYLIEATTRRVFPRYPASNRR
jgi:hypothetical protein